MSKMFFIFIGIELIFLKHSLYRFSIVLFFDNIYRL